MSAHAAPQPAPVRTSRQRPVFAQLPASEPVGSVPPGLVWVTDSEPGIRRVRRGAQVVYLDAQGRRVRDEATLARIRQLAVPPAYESVWICARPEGHLQATGRDVRGRKQYRYHAQWQKQRGANKFAAMRTFGAVLPRIRARVLRDLCECESAPAGLRPTRTLVLATLVRLLDTTFVRIGNEAYARDNGSYGLTTLRTHHAGVQDAEVRLSFKGKSGVRQEVTLADRRVATVVRRCKALPGQELFQYVDADGATHKVTSADVNDYLCDAAGVHVTAKDFRTWHGSVLALEFTRTACAGIPVRGAATEVIARVAARLGNTAAVCRKSYIHPTVLALGAALADEAGRAGLLAQPWAASTPDRQGGRGSTRARTLSAAERGLLALLEHGAGTDNAQRAKSGTRSGRSGIC